MAIDPKLLVIKPVDELTEVTGLQDGDLLFYDGSGNLKRISIETFNNLSKTATPLKPTDTTPTVDGLYMPTEIGTYANAGGLIAEDGFDTLFYFNGTTWTKRALPYPKASNNLPQFANLSFPVTNTATEKVQCVDNFVPYQLLDGKTSTSVDVPSTSPTIWTSMGVVNQTITNITQEFNVDPSQIVPSEALYNDETLAGDILKRVDKTTGENVNYRETTTWHDGSVMNDSKADGVIYIKKGSKFYELINFTIGFPLNVKWFGAKGDGVSDDSEKIQKAIDFCSLTKRVLFIPKTENFYLLDCLQLFGDESSVMIENVKVALEIKSNMKIFSDGAILKIKSGVSSHATPTPMRMFFSNNFLENIHFDGLVLDMNGQNNLISPNLPTQSNNFTQAHIIFSGTKGNIAAGANNVIIENCEFINNTGVSCICMSQSNTQNVELGKNWIVRNNRFYNNGLDSSDHSSIFAWANDVQCYGNTFDNPQPFENWRGGLVAYEIHGSNHKIYNNKINNYYQGFWLSINLSQSKIENIEVYNNTALISCVFIDVYHGNLETAPYYPVSIDGVKIYNNTVVITDDFVADTLKQFIRFGSKFHPDNVVISNNKLINKTTVKKTVFVSLIVFANHEKTANNITFINNVAENVGDGILFFWAKNMNYGNIEITNNSFTFNPNLYDAHNVEIFGSGTTSGQVSDFVINNASKLLTDNNNRFIIKGNHTIKPQLSVNGISNIGDGYINYEVVNNGKTLSVNALIMIGSTTIFSGLPLSIKMNGATAIQTSVGDVFLTANGNRYKVFGIVDNTGQWLSIYSDVNTPVTNIFPEVFKAGDFISAKFDIVHNGIIF